MTILFSGATKKKKKKNKEMSIFEATCLGMLCNCCNEQYTRIHYADKTYSHRLCL
jgi:hypothetical protein